MKDWKIKENEMYSILLSILTGFTPAEILIIWIGVCFFVVVLVIFLGIMWLKGKNQGREIKRMRVEIDRIPEIFNRLDSMDLKLSEFQEYLEQDTENRATEHASIINAISALSKKIEENNQHKNGVSD